MRTRTVPLPDLDIFVREMGAGEPVLCLHGSLETGESFDHMGASLARNFHVIVPDQRCHGRSHPARCVWNHTDLARDARDLLLALGIERAHVVGHSMGGDIALIMADRYPDFVQSLTSIGSAGFPGTDIERHLSRFLPLSKARTRWPMFIADLARRHGLFSDDALEELVRTTLENGMRYPELSDEAIGRLAMPFLLLAGEHDRLTPDEDVERLKHAHPALVFRRIRGAGHAPHAQGPWFEETLEALQSFLGNSRRQEEETPSA